MGGLTFRGGNSTCWVLCRDLFSKGICSLGVCETHRGPELKFFVQSSAFSRNTLKPISILKLLSLANYTCKDPICKPATSRHCPGTLESSTNTLWQYCAACGALWHFGCGVKDSVPCLGSISFQVGREALGCRELVPEGWQAHLGSSNEPSIQDVNTVARNDCH